MKNHSRNLHAPLCSIFCPNSVTVARYGTLIRTKSHTNCDAHLAESLFQTCSRDDRSAWRNNKKWKHRKGFHFLLYDHCYSLYNNKTFNHHHSFPYFTAAVMIHRHHRCRKQGKQRWSKRKKITSLNALYMITVHCGITDHHGKHNQQQRSQTAKGDKCPVFPGENRGVSFYVYKQ